VPSYATAAFTAGTTYSSLGRRHPVSILLLICQNNEKQYFPSSIPLPSHGEKKKDKTSTLFFTLRIKHK
jgi:hypothetical protein